MDPNTAKTVYGMIHPDLLVNYNEGVSVDPNGKYNNETGVWSANGRQMVWNPKYNQWVIISGDPAGGGGDSLPTTTTTRTTGTSGPAKVLSQGALSATQKAIDSLGREQEVGEKNIEDDYTSLMTRYDNEGNRVRADYDEGIVTNNTNLAKNKQNSLLAAAQGRRGLRGVLGSIGALFGDGGKLADRAVMTGANADIGEAVNTATSNQTSLDKAKRNFDEEDEDRRLEAATARKNQLTALEGQILKERQEYFQKMAEIYGDADMTGDADSWLGKAGDLNDDIAAKGRVQATPFTRRAAAFTPGKLADYLAGNTNMTVSVAGGGPGMAGPTSMAAGRTPFSREEEEERLI